MHYITQLLINTVSFAFVISIIVFIHEFGHFWVARRFGVKIDVFSIGFGKEIWGWNDRKGTRWRIAYLPLGGYVRMFGDASEASTPSDMLETLSESEKRRTFHFQPLYAKAAIVAAGPLSNFLLTICIFTALIITNGIPSTEPIAGSVMPDTPAQAAGLKAGDKIISINGEKIAKFSDIPREIMLNLGTPVALIVERGEQTMNITLTPKLITEKDDLGNNYTRAIIGIKSQEIHYADVGPLRAVWEAMKATYEICHMTLQAIFQMLSGDRSASDSIKGPISIAQLSGQAAQKGPEMVVYFMAMLSANLGLINLFPIPMLDGGHLLYYIIEGVQRKPLAKQFQQYGFRIGMAMLAMLMAFAIVNDVRNFFS